MSHTRASHPSRPVHDVTVKRLRIPMRDGVRLFATAWHPKGDDRFPAVINYDPYRSADGRTLGRGNWFHYLARHGYVVLHLGVRGTDGSEGTVGDEYLPQEQLDGYDAIEWLAQQPWCNGNLGMMGTSYSGFTCLQVATHRPPASRESSRSSRPTIVPLTTCTTRRVGRSERSATCATTD